MYKWTGYTPRECEICVEPLDKTFIDGKTTFGPWGIMCPKCHTTHGVGHGLGKGQEYSIETHIKIKG